MTDTGQLVISLDTELSWGSFDTAGVSTYKQAYWNTRPIIISLCDLFDEYDAPVTWALVMHLLDDCDGHEELNTPDYEWVDWFNAVPCATKVEKNLWYAPDIFDQIRSTEVDHEIGLHGYSHLIMGAEGCTQEAAESEIRKAIEVAKRNGLDPDTYVFPRNNIGHLDVLRDAGIQFYRGVDARWYERRTTGPFRKTLRFADEALQWTPPVVTPRETNGLVELPGSQILRPFRGPWRHTPQNSQLVRARKGLDRAVSTGGVYHLWFHPFNLGINPGKHLDLVKDILSYASELRDSGQLEICTIADAARYD